MLVVLCGGHTSGKSTIGRLLKQRGYAFYPELGDILRSDDSAHSINAEQGERSWDEFVFQKEEERDAKIASLMKDYAKLGDDYMAFVETWHIQNL